MEKNEFDFDSNSEFDEDAILSPEDMALMKLIAYLPRTEENKKDSILNLNRVNEVLSIYKMLLEEFKRKNGIQMSLSMNDPCTTGASINIKGKEIPFNNLKRFMNAADKADGLEGYVLADGTIELIFIFFGMTMPLE